MKRTHCYFLVLAIFLSMQTFSQQVGINEDGSLPNPSAILDVKSNKKGVLIPRMSSGNRQAIPNVKGLLVYDTTTSTIWYNTGVEWKNLISAPAGNAWSLTGNDNTGESNFLGTTDDAPLRIRVKNSSSGLIDGSYALNTFLGYQSGSLTIPHMGGASNTAFGGNSLKSNVTGGGNTSVGTAALQENISGYYNNAFGSTSLSSNTTGHSNAAYGNYSLRYTNGNGNTALGTLSSYYNFTANHNTATGYESMFKSQSGGFNTADGAFAMHEHQSGYFNVALGSYSMQETITSNYNTAVGAFASVQKYSGFNSTAIGFFAFADRPNKIRLGNNVVTAIEGMAPFTTPSDGRYKFNVREDVKGLDFVMKLRPVTYQFDVKKFDEAQQTSIPDSISSYEKGAVQAAYTEATGLRRSGFIAQEVEKAADETGYNFNGLLRPQDEKSHYSLSYESFVVPLVKAIQEQQKLIVQLQQQVSVLQKLLPPSK